MKAIRISALSVAHCAALLLGCDGPSPSALRSPDVSWGASARSLRVASWNVENLRRDRAGVFAELRAIDADVVALQEVQEKDHVALQRELGYAHATFVPELFPPNSNVDADSKSRGIMILSRFQLNDAAPIPNPGGGTRGIWATVIVDDRKFVFASVHLTATWQFDPKSIAESFASRGREIANFRDAWYRLGKPPVILAGDFNQPPTGANYTAMTDAWRDAFVEAGEARTTLQHGPAKLRVDYVLLSEEWSAAEAMVRESRASDHRPLTITLRAK